MSLEVVIDNNDQSVLVRRKFFKNDTKHINGVKVWLSNMNNASIVSAVMESEEFLRKASGEKYENELVVLKK